MKVVINHLKDASLITISGRIDSDTSPEVARAFQSVQNTGQFFIIVDMVGLEYVSSATLRALMVAQRASKRNQKEVVLLRVPDNILIVLDMAGLITLFRMINDPAELPELNGFSLDEVPRAEPFVKKNQEAAA